MSKRESALARVERRVPGSFGSPEKKLNRINTAMAPARSRESAKNPTNNTDRYNVVEINLYGP